MPEDSTADTAEDADTEYKERLHISSENSYNRFKGKYLTGLVDQSEKMGHNEFDVRSECWELAGQGEKETPIEKYRRLKCEMDELMREIVDLNASAEVSKEQKKSYEAVSNVVNSTRKVLNSLRLEQVLGTESVATADGEVKKLITQVEDFRKKRDTPKVEAPVERLRIAELESRLSSLEKIIGTQPERLTRLTSTLETNGTLLDSIQQISTKAALLQPSQLDTIEARIAALTTKLDEINQKTAKLSEKGANDEEVFTVYDIAKRTEPLATLLPTMLQRMQALEELHKYGMCSMTTCCRLTD